MANYLNTTIIDGNGADCDFAPLSKFTNLILPSINLISAL
jgi:hypothetical protein